LNKVDTKAKVLDIAMNLNRLGNWAADDYDAKKERIKTFLGNTTFYIKSLDTSQFPVTFANTFKDFNREYTLLEKEALVRPKETIVWAEKMMTWGNILTHRSKLLD